MRFTDSEVDQARAAGVVIEFDRGYPLIVDRALYRELVKQAITRTVDELEVKVAERAARGRPAVGRSTDQPAGPAPPTPSASSVSCASSQTRRTASTSISAPACSRDWRPSTRPTWTWPARSSTACWAPTTTARRTRSTGERVVRLAVSGIRLVIDEFRADVTKTRKDGSRGRLRIDYGDPAARRSRQVAVEIRRRRSDRRRAVWPRVGRHRR